MKYSIKQKTFVRIYQHSIKKQHQFINLIYNQNYHNDFNFAIVIKRKTANSVMRNKIKRQIRFILYNLHKKLLGYNIILVIKENFTINKFVDLKIYIEHILYNILNK